MKSMKKWRKHSIGASGLLALGTVLLVGQGEAQASCTTQNEEKFSNQWFYTQGFCAIRDSGESLLSDVGKQLLASSLDAFAPGASAIFGLGQNDPFERWARQILDAIDASSGAIHDHIDEFWEWAKNTNNAANQAKVNGTLLEVEQWKLLTDSQKFAQSSRLTGILSDVSLVRQVLSTVVLGKDKVDWLQTYAHIVDLELILVAERAKMDVLLPFASDPRFDGNLATLHSRLTPEERATIERNVQTLTRQLWTLTLETGPNAVMGYIEGPQVLGAFFEYTDARFTWRNTNGMSTSTPQQCCGSTPPNWKYWVDGRPDGCTADRKPDPEDCPNTQDGGFWCGVYWPTFETRSEECPEFNFNTEGGGNFDNVIMTSAEHVVPQHKWVVRGDMITEAYGPIRRKMDLWRNMLHETPRAYNALDREMDQYLGALSPLEAEGKMRYRGTWGGKINPLVNIPAVALNSCAAPIPGQPRFTVEQYNVAMGFAIDQGTDRLVALLCAPRPTGAPVSAAVHARALVSPDPEAAYREFDAALMLFGAGMAGG